MKVVVSGYIGKKITGIGRNLISLLDVSESGIEYVIYTNYDIAKDFQFRNPRVTVKTYPVSSQDSMKNLLWTTFVFPLVVLKEGADRALIPNFTLLLFKFRRTAVILNDLIEFHVPQKFSKLHSPQGGYPDHDFEEFQAGYCKIPAYPAGENRRRLLRGGP